MNSRDIYMKIAEKNYLEIFKTDINSQNKEIVLRLS